MLWLALLIVVGFTLGAWGLYRLAETQGVHMTALDDSIALLITNATADTNAVNSAIGVINGIQAELQAAQAAALAAGATSAQLASIAAVSAGLAPNVTGIANSIAANTPAASQVRK